MLGFIKKREKKAPKVIMHSELGELRYVINGWETVSAVKLDLWGKSYNVSLNFYADTEEDEPNSDQENAYQKFRGIMVEQRNVIERLLLDYSKEEIMENAGDRILPRNVEFSRKGECALFFEDTEDGIAYEDDTNAGIALFLIPRILIDSSENCFDYMCGYRDTSMREDLYGEL